MDADPQKVPIFMGSLGWMKIRGCDANTNEMSSCLLNHVPLKPAIRETYLKIYNTYNTKDAPDVDPWDHFSDQEIEGIAKCLSEMRIEDALFKKTQPKV